MRIWRPQGAPLTPFLSTKGRGGPRRTATATHLSTEDTEGRGELQRRLQLPFLSALWATKGLPIVFSQWNTKNCNGNTFVHGAPTRGAPTRRTFLNTLWPRDTGRPQGGPYNFFSRYGRGKGCPQEDAEGRGELQRQLSFVHALWPGELAPTTSFWAPLPRRTATSFVGVMAGEGRHKGRPYQLVLSHVMAGEGNHKGRPYQQGVIRGRAPTRGPIVFSRSGGPEGHKTATATVFSRSTNGLGRAPTRGARNTDCTLSFLGVMAWGRAPTRGAPTDCSLLSDVMAGEGAHKGRPYRLSSSALWPGEGAHKGRPYQLSFLGVTEGTHKGRPYQLGVRAPTRGAPTNCLFSALWPGEGTHKGRPYRLSFLGVMAWGGRPQGAPLPIVFSRRRAGKGAHKGRPYRLSFLGVMAWGGHPQGAPLPIVFSRRYGLGRAPTRGAPTDCLLFFSALWPGEGTHKGRPYRLSFLGVMAWGGRPQGAPLPIVFFRRYGLGGAPTDCLFSALWPGAPTRGAPTDCLLSALCPGEGAHKGRPYPIQAASRGFF